jgi:hypothetical protein
MFLNSSIPLKNLTLNKIKEMYYPVAEEIHKNIQHAAHRFSLTPLYVLAAVADAQYILLFCLSTIPISPI